MMQGIVNQSCEATILLPEVAQADRDYNGDTTFFSLRPLRLCGSKYTSVKVLIILKMI